MTPHVTRPILYDYFKKSADVLLAEYERSKAQEATDNLGYNRELFCSNFLSRVLPSRITLRRGEVWDAQGNRTGQLEIVMLRDDCPSLMFGEADTYLVEGVFGVIEVKSNLSKTKLQEALSTLKRVKSLNLTSEGAVMTSGSFLSRPLRCVFAYEGATWATLLEELVKPDNSDVADLVCILNRGALISKGLLLNWPDNASFYKCDGKAAALAWLYFHLVSYSTSFTARSLNILQYFEPLNSWAD